MNKKLAVTLAAAVWLTACAAEDNNITNANTTNSGDVDSHVTCKGDVCTMTAPINDPITKNITLTSDKQWLIKGGVFVGDDKAETVLTIEAGTTVYGDTSSKAFMVIRRGSKIEAAGTKDAPIVFTSSKAPGSRAPGDWGGLVINGKAVVNGCDNLPCESEGEGGSGKYGGSDDADNSGTLKYVRVEFAGHPITEDNELNGIAFQGVGSGTTIEYVQVHMAADDGVEFFGGAAQFKYVLTTGISDDNLDWTDGWRGKGQFFVAQQRDDMGDNGIEADNNGDANDTTPRSQPTLANITLIGSPDSKTSDMGLLLREGTGANIYNALVLGWNDTCLDIDHTSTFSNANSDGTEAGFTGNLTMVNSHLGCAKPLTMGDQYDKVKDGETCKDSSAPTVKGEGEKKELRCYQKDPWSLEDFFTLWNEGNTKDTKYEGVLNAPFNFDAPDFTPKAGGGADRNGTTPAGDDFFVDTKFIGGVDPANDWTKGWTTTASN